MEPTQLSNDEAVAFTHQGARCIDGQRTYPSDMTTGVPRRRASEYAR